MNQASIAQTVNTIYGINGYEYLRKFFDFTFKLEISAKVYLKNLLTEFATKFNKLKGNNISEDYPEIHAYNCLSYGSKEVLNKVDNRELSRYYDALLNICNDFGWERLTSRYVFFIIVGLYIRKNVSASFLDESELYDARKNFYINSTRDIDQVLANGEMPYFDYLCKYLGIDRKKLPEKIYQEYNYNNNKIPELSWYFNVIIYYSVSEYEYGFNAMRRFKGQPPIRVEDCKTLRRLIILYGGEQEK